jgi:hypothetical protein
VNKTTRAVLAGVGTLALALAPLSMACARDHGREGHHGYRGHDLWVGAAIAGAVVGIVTLPFRIVSAAVDPDNYRARADYRVREDYYPPYQRDYAPAPRYYAPPRRDYGAPEAGYAPPESYYRSPQPDYAPAQSYYDEPRGYAPPRSGYYDYPR